MFQEQDGNRASVVAQPFQSRMLHLHAAELELSCKEEPNTSCPIVPMKLPGQTTNAKLRPRLLTL